ncbi:MAG: SDR family oxidoreductase [Planctomycetes bacterium]|nr:SDR family oxidoreductase [Planctomycetota bacterium]MBI3834325.1 SDR family oxidoreductase [Planctomycetota bacterium]
MSHSRHFAAMVDNQVMRVLVTGHKGYIGSVLTPVLRATRFEVAGLDCDLYAGCDFGRVREEPDAFDCDICRIESSDLVPFDAVIHLAGIPELGIMESLADAVSGIAATLVHDVNVAGTLRLAECCRQAGVARFIFASSCAIYGSRGDEWLHEESDARPLTAYAASKLLGERSLLKLFRLNFNPISLRLGTVYGGSPRMRLDTVVNDFTAAAMTTGRIAMATDGRAWRPLLHVHDVARAILAVLQTPTDQIAQRVFNLARAEENFRIIDVADLVQEHIFGSSRIAATGMRDVMSYRVDGSRFAQAFPSFRWRYGLADGIKQLRAAYANAGLTQGDWRCDRFRRAMRLSAEIESGELERRLQPCEPAAA